METLSTLLALCAGNHRSPVTSSHKGQWRGAFVFSLICTLTNSWVNNRDASDLRRHRAHYDLTVMRIPWGEDTTSFEELEKCSEIPRWCHCNQEMDTISSYIILQLITIWTRCLAFWNEKYNRHFTKTAAETFCISDPLWREFIGNTQIFQCHDVITNAIYHECMHPLTASRLSDTLTWYLFYRVKCIVVAYSNVIYS